MSVTSHRSRFTKLVCGALMLCASLAFAAEGVKDGGPYVPTPPDVVRAMLELARVGSRDFVVDLGSGDGRIVLTAAQKYKARGMGVDIDPELVELANASARKQEVADRVRFFQQDVFAADRIRATVLTLYLLPAMMERLRPKLLKELKPGTRIVSHDFDFGEWEPDRSIEVNTPEKYEISGGVLPWCTCGSCPPRSGARFHYREARLWFKIGTASLEVIMQTDFSMNRRRALLALGALPVARLVNAAELERTGGPYVPTPQVVVDEMLRMAKVGPGDFVVDLGSGDGVIVLTAAQKHKARGFGVDIDPELVKLSNNEAKKRGVADRAVFYVQDVFKADISKATVVTLYLLPGMMVNLRPKIFGELRPGARVVSHDYHFDDWTPDHQFTWDVPEKEKVNGIGQATVYLWIVPARIAGRWQVKTVAPGGSEQFELAVKQVYQNFEGSVNLAGGQSVRLTQSRLRGEEISFAFPAGGDRHLFRGKVSGDAMEGTVELASGKGIVKWTATRRKS